MNPKLQLALSRYGGKKLGAGSVMVKCPCHPDKTESLKLWTKDDGRIGNHCFAGCQFQDVDAALVSDGIQQPFKPGQTETSQERQERERRQAEAKQQRAIAELGQAKKAIETANQIWGGTVHV